MKRTSRKLKGKSKGSRPIRQNRPDYRKEIIGYKSKSQYGKCARKKIKRKTFIKVIRR